MKFHGVEIGDGNVGPIFYQRHDLTGEWHHGAGSIVRIQCKNCGQWILAEDYQEICNGKT